MSGLNLREMEANEMMDVLHYLFESDLTTMTPEMLDRQARVRDRIAEEMYGVAPQSRYTESYPEDVNPYEPENADADTETLKPFNPRTEPIKPNIPISHPDIDSATPFGLDIGTPLN